MAKEYGFIGVNPADNLIADIKPDLKVGGGEIAHDETEAVYERGTVLARDTETNKLYILGSEKSESLVADCILCDRVKVGTQEDVAVPVYIGGSFNKNDLIVKAEYQIKEEDIQALRQRGIVVTASMQVDNETKD